MKFNKGDTPSNEIIHHYQYKWSQTLSDWVNDYQTKLIDGFIYWRGIPVIQSPQDLWIFQEIITDRQPEVIIEIGSLAGGLTQYLADLLLLIGGKRRVVALDIDHSHFRAESPLIDCITGDSGDPGIASEIAETCKNKQTMIIHDSCHHADAVFDDLVTYSPLVTKGQYFIAADGIIDLFHGQKVKLSKRYPGPLVAVEKFLEQAPEFRADLEREKLVVTYNPRSFLELILD